MKKCFLFIILFIIIISNKNIYADTDTSCKSVILVDADSGRVLFSKNMNQKIYPASLTKLLTALTALDIGSLDDILIVDDNTPFEVDGSHIALEPEEKLTLEELLYGLLIASGNDVAQVIAKNYSTYEGEFLELMNEKAKELGALNSNFTNPHGLHNDNHYSTAYDLSRIAVEAYKNEIISKIVKTTKYTIDETNIKDAKRHIISTNKLLVGIGYGNQIIIDNKWVDMKYDGADGMKTGYTPEAGSCLIGSASRNNLNLISVVVNGSRNEVYTDTHNILNYGFENFEKKILVHKNEFVDNITVENGDSNFVSLISDDSISAVISPEESQLIKSHINIKEYSLPIKKDTILGSIEYKLKDELIGKASLVSTFGVNYFSQEEINLTTVAVKSILFFVLFIIIFIFVLRIINRYRLYKIRKYKKSRRN